MVEDEVDRLSAFPPCDEPNIRWKLGDTPRRKMKPHMLHRMRLRKSVMITNEDHEGLVGIVKETLGQAITTRIGECCSKTTIRS